MSDRRNELPRPPIKVPTFPPPHLLLWPGLRKGSALWRLRRAYRIAWRRRFAVRDYCRMGFALLAWPPAAAVLAFRSTRANGARYRRQTGVGLVSQFLAQAYLAIVHRMLPHYYYVFELQRPELFRRAAEYLTRTETKGGVYRALKQRENRHLLVHINDKLVFSAFYQKHKVRAVPVLAGFRAGARLADIGPAELPAGADLFVKPIEGRGGGGTESWQALPDRRYRNSHGVESTLTALLDHVATLSKQGGEYLIQPRLTNHPDIADLTPGALSTVRLLTILNEAGEPEAVNAAFRMAISKTSPVDNFHAGGIAAAVDMQTGMLGPASGLGLGGDFAWHETHPLTGGRIVGRRLPDWRTAVDLAVAAHRLLAPRVIVGWDVGFLPDGPCLVEGNVGPDADIHQRVERRPVGNARYGELLAFHLERRLGL
jgi:hypothetical protein